MSHPVKCLAIVKIAYSDTCTIAQKCQNIFVLLYLQFEMHFTGEEKGEGADRDTAGGVVHRVRRHPEVPTLQVRAVRLCRGDPRRHPAALQGPFV